MVFYYLFFVTKKPYSQINLEATPPSLYAQATVPVAHESETR